MKTIDQYYPPVGFSFKVNVEGITGVNEGSFQEVSGLNVKISPKKYRRGWGESVYSPFPHPS